MQRRPRRENKKHLRWIAERACLVCGSSPCDAAHIKHADSRVCKPLSSNIGMKADDRFTIPLCRRHHEECHQLGEKDFFLKYACDPILIALALYSVSGDDQEGDHLVRMTYACPIVWGPA
jgi:Putative HNHc nuclease